MTRINSQMARKLRLVDHSEFHMETNACHGPWDPRAWPGGCIKHLIDGL